jgi:hypothetical protein
VVGSDWIFASTCDHQPRLNTLAKGARIDASAEMARSREICKDIGHLISFVSPTQGWIVVGDGDLMSTTDGGASWTRISPGPASIQSSEDPSALESFEEHVFPGESSNEPNSQTVPMVLSALPSGVGSVISKHLGFESQFTGTETEMQTWWNYSPFYDVGIYLNGADNHLIDTNLDDDWVSAVTGQGWGVMPIWDGLQAPKPCIPPKTHERSMSSDSKARLEEADEEGSFATFRPASPGSERET